MTRLWMHPNITPYIWAGGSAGFRYQGAAQTAQAFTEPEWGPAVSRCDVISLFVDAGRDRSTGEPAAPDCAGTDGYLRNLVAMANRYGKQIAIEVGGPAGHGEHPSVDGGTVDLSTGALSAAYDLTTTIANVGGMGGSVAYLSMDHPVQRVMDGFAMTVNSVSAQNPARVSVTAGHGLQTGDVVTIAGTTANPTVNGVRTVTVIDPIWFSVPVNVNVAGQDAPGGTVSQSLRQGIAQTVEYVQTIHAAHPAIGVGLVDQHGNYVEGVGAWRPTGAAVGYGLGALVDALAAVGETLAFLNIDCPYEYQSGGGTPSPFGDSLDWGDLLADIQAAAVAEGVPFGMVVNSAFGGGGIIEGADPTTYHLGSPGPGSDARFQSQTLLYVEQLRRRIAAGAMTPLDHLVVESWAYYPRDLAPDTTPGTWCDTFLKARAVFLG